MPKKKPTKKKAEDEMTNITSQILKELKFNREAQQEEKKEKQKDREIWTIAFETIAKTASDVLLAYQDSVTDHQGIGEQTITANCPFCFATITAPISAKVIRCHICNKELEIELPGTETEPNETDLKLQEMEYERINMEADLAKKELERLKAQIEKGCTRADIESAVEKKTKNQETQKINEGRDIKHQKELEKHQKEMLELNAIRKELEKDLRHKAFDELYNTIKRDIIEEIQDE